MALSQLDCSNNTQTSDFYLINRNIYNRSKRQRFAIFSCYSENFRLSSLLINDRDAHDIITENIDSFFFRCFTLFGLFGNRSNFLLLFGGCLHFWCRRGLCLRSSCDIGSFSFFDRSFCGSFRFLPTLTASISATTLTSFSSYRPLRRLV